MGLLQHIFGKKNKNYPSLDRYFQAINGYAPVYTSHDGGLYELGLVRAAVHRSATECSKAKPVLSKSSKRIEFIVKKRPNEFMTASQFYYRVATIWELENNAFIVPIEDKYGKITGMFPVCPSQAELTEKNGVVYIVYTFANGEQKAIEYNKCAHLRRMQYKDDFFGDNNEAFRSTADLVKADETGTNEAITNGSRLRFKGKLNSQVIDKEDLKDQQQFVSDMNLNNNATGVFIYDSRFEDMTELKNQFTLLDAKQKEAIENSVFTYWGTNKDILQNTYDEVKWSAYYESHIKPFFIQLGEAITNMFYTYSQQMEGNEISYTSNQFDYVPMKTKLECVPQFFDRGMISMDTGLDIVDLPPTGDKDGNKRFIRAEYISVENASSVGKGVTDSGTGNSETKFDSDVNKPFGEEKD